ncbi:MAG: hypothetical protein ACFFG0_02250 [Candidatus Thorarchaeota archaeon]
MKKIKIDSLLTYEPQIDGELAFGLTTERKAEILRTFINGVIDECEKHKINELHSSDELMAIENNIFVSMFIKKQITINEIFALANIMLKYDYLEFCKFDREFLKKVIDDEL